ncbi:three-prime repair exonuclease 1-like [Chironomus tepperi]|uniref:three-prime repair exonuclease 1-like n=1 Tax=Chironomus tepperi TaxID=113505 RepID=UPI00391F3A99
MQNEQVTSTASSFKTFAFIDLETTGLPSIEYNRTKITQISITACSVEHIMELKDKEAIPRVLHKLSLCLNPRKLIKLDCTEITGLSNELLQNEKKFDENTVDLVNNFLAHLQQPVCLVAHNGNKFDYPILKSHCKLLNKPLHESLICCDSLIIFRKIDEIYEQNSRTLINGYKMTSWERIQTQQVLMMDAEILEVENLLKNYDSDENLLTITQLETEFIRNVPQDVKSEPDDDIQARQRQNETTPTKPVKVEEKNAPSKHPGSSANKKRPSSAARRELFPGTSEQPKTSPKNGKKIFPKGYYTLRKIYKRFFGVHPENSHDSEADVIALLKCVCACKKEFLDVAIKTACNFSDIKDL